MRTRSATLPGGLPASVPTLWPQKNFQTVPRTGSFWGIEGRSKARTCIARLSDRVEVSEVPERPLAIAGYDELGVSRLGTLAVAKVKVVASGEQLIVASLYAPFERALPYGSGIYADASMHRLLSDLSPVLSYRKLPAVIAGDFNSVLGWSGDDPGADWTARNSGVFQRLSDLGLHLAGPQASKGVQADPNQPGLPADTLNVPTFRPAPDRPAASQLDYVYVSEELAQRTSVTAQNDNEQWGPSDHCRIVIEIAP